MIVYHAARLEGGVRGDRASEREPVPPQILGKRFRLGRPGGHVGQGNRGFLLAARIVPDQNGQPAGQGEGGPRVADDSLDLGPVPDDAAPATASMSNPANAERNPSRLRRIVSQDSPDWNASRLSRSNMPVSSRTGRPHSSS
jgi:hypothetical protein